MKNRLCPVVLFLLAALPAWAADPVLTMNVWPGPPPGDNTGPSDEHLNTQTMSLTGTVTTPTIAVYRPAKDKDTGVSMLVLPGGGFTQLSMGHEGIDVATWLNSIGVTGIVLKYRIPNRPGLPRYLAAVQDAQRAMSIIRTKARDWGLDPHRVGAIGFSAGGQTAADIETNFEKRFYEPIDDTDKAETRPDFVALIYPGGIFQKSSEVPAVTEDVHVSKDTPPTFLCIANDDRNGAENAVYMYLALKRVGVPTELHVYGEGGHGFGIRPGKAPHTSWPARLQDWMTFRGLFKPTDASSAPAPSPKPAQ